MGARILVVDDDPWIVRMVTASLEKHRYVVDAAMDGREALARAEAVPPRVILSDILMPVMDGWALVGQLRKRPRLSRIPVLFLTAVPRDEARLAQLGLGPEHYIGKPFRFEDLVRSVARAVAQTSVGSSVPPPPPGARRAPRPAQPPAASADGVPPSIPPPPPPHRPSTALNGRLEQLQLSSLLIMMELERKAGVLTLHGPDRGRIFLHGGQVVGAKLEAYPGLEGRECVYAMLQWREGTFSFTPMEVDMPDTVQSSTTHLLMEGARRLDERNRESSRS